MGLNFNNNGTSNWADLITGAGPQQSTQQQPQRTLKLTIEQQNIAPNQPQQQQKQQAPKLPKK